MWNDIEKLTNEKTNSEKEVGLKRANTGQSYLISLLEDWFEATSQEPGMLIRVFPVTHIMVPLFRDCFFLFFFF